jgi:pimeloyl-ACP methyl ester carboxylesterase
MPITADGIHYVTTDLRPPWVTSGLPVVFNHGIGTNLDIWAEWVPVIAASHPMLRFDMRGFGKSAIPARASSMVDGRDGEGFVGRRGHRRRRQGSPGR